VAYLGNRSLHVPLSFDNNYIETTPAICAEFGTGGAPNCSNSGSQETQRRRLYQIATNGVPIVTKGQFTPQFAEGYGFLYYGDDTGYANYNAVLATLQHRLRHGVNLQANYTYSHCLSDGDFNGDLRGEYYMIPTEPSIDYGSCNFDIRHILNGTAVVTSPFNRAGLVKWLAGGWQFAPSIRLMSGYPINVGLGKDSLATGNEGADRAELVPGVPIYKKGWTTCQNQICYQWFNPAAFADPTCTSSTCGGNDTVAPVQINPKNGTPYAYPFIGRDAYYGPGMFNFDAALSRLFPLLHERTQLELRFEAFNVINHQNLRVANIASAVNTNGSNFGAVTQSPAATFLPSPNDPRILQFAAKVHW